MRDFIKKHTVDTESNTNTASNDIQNFDAAVDTGSNILKGGDVTVQS